jgi:hypothetical protein
MRINKSYSDEAEEFSRPIDKYLQGMMRDYLVCVAREIFKGWVKEKAVPQKIKDEVPATPSQIPESTTIIIILLQLFRRIKLEKELDAIAHKYDYEVIKLCNQIAVSRTYVEVGDGAQFADDEALLMIRDLLIEFDDTIINRNRFRRMKNVCKSGYRFGKRRNLKYQCDSD